MAVQFGADEFKRRLASAKAKESNATLPVGEYAMALVKTFRGKTKKDAIPMVCLTWEVIEGPCMGMEHPMFYMYGHPQQTWQFDRMVSDFTNLGYDTEQLQSEQALDAYLAQMKKDNLKAVLNIYVNEKGFTTTVIVSVISDTELPPAEVKKDAVVVNATPAKAITPPAPAKPVAKVTPPKSAPAPAPEAEVEAQPEALPEVETEGEPEVEAKAEDQQMEIDIGSKVTFKHNGKERIGTIKDSDETGANVKIEVLLVGNKVQLLTVPVTDIIGVV